MLQCVDLSCMSTVVASGCLVASGGHVVPRGRHAASGDQQGISISVVRGVKCHLTSSYNGRCSNRHFMMPHWGTINIALLILKGEMKIINTGSPPDALSTDYWESTIQHQALDVHLPSHQAVGRVAASLY